MGGEMPPDWAIERALRGSGYTVTVPAEVRNGSMNHAKEAILAFARYIAEHEDPPVDPLVLEAREILASNSEADEAEDIRAGNWDDVYPLPLIELALRRGIELAKENGHGGEG